MTERKVLRKEVQKLLGKGKTQRRIEKQTGATRKAVNRAQREIERRTAAR